VCVLASLRSFYHQSVFHAGHRVRARHMLAAVADLAPHGRVLDAGSGGGSYSFAIARRFPHLEVEGIELDPHKVAECEARAQAEGRSNLHFLVGDITRIGRPAHYDLALSVDVLEHIPDDAAAFRSLANALRPGGILLLHVPYVEPRRFIASLNEHHQDDHVREGYEPLTLALLLEQAGFEAVEVQRTFGPAGELAWELMHLARRAPSSRFRYMAGVLCSPLAALLCELDFLLGGGARGNGVLARARRASG
jgi:SAM-dependent methyltransferase